MTTLTKDLSGADLDYWVAKARGLTPVIQIAQRSDGFRICVVGSARYAPSSDWSQGGPIIDLLIANNFAIIPKGNYSETIDVGNRDGECTPYDMNWDAPHVYGWGDTVLTAAMRAYVAGKFGDIVSEEMAPC